MSISEADWYLHQSRYGHDEGKKQDHVLTVLEKLVQAVKELEKKVARLERST